MKKILFLLLFGTCCLSPMFANAAQGESVSKTEISAEGVVFRSTKKAVHQDKTFAFYSDGNFSFTSDSHRITGTYALRDESTVLEMYVNGECIDYARIRVEGGRLIKFYYDGVSYTCLN